MCHSQTYGSQIEYEFSKVNEAYLRMAAFASRDTKVKIAKDHDKSFQSELATSFRGNVH